MIYFVSPVSVLNYGVAIVFDAKYLPIWINQGMKKIPLSVCIILSEPTSKTTM